MIQIFQVPGLDISVEIEDRVIVVSIGESGAGFDELKVFYEHQAAEGSFLHDKGPYLALHVGGDEE